MNYSMILYIIGWILSVEAALMVPSVIVSAIYRESSGFALAAGSGEKDWLMMGFMEASRRGIPVEMPGFLSSMISGAMVSLLGIKLKMLSTENGQINRTATMPQSSTVVHFGAFFNRSRNTRTASTSQVALMPRLTTCKNSSVMLVLLSVAVDHTLYSVDFLLRQRLMLGKCGDKGR